MTSPNPNPQQGYVPPQTPPQQNPPYAAYQTPQPVTVQPVYQVSERDRKLRCVAFAFMVVSCVATGWLLIPLAWMIPMTIMSYEIWQGTRANTVAFGVCTVIFASMVSGVLLLVSKQDA